MHVHAQNHGITDFSHFHACRSSILRDTVNTLYTNTYYNNKIRYNDNLNITKHSLKRLQLLKIMQKHCIKSSSNIYFGYLLELPQRGDSNKYPKHNVL